jgi:UDP-N-acetylmuramate dehydrogenase
VFKQKLKNKYVICSVRLRLTKTNHRLTLDYGSIKDVLSQSGIDNPSIRDVAAAVISIRQSKLPDPKILGNSGSFFKNPIITKKTADQLKVNYPQLPNYDTGDGQQKIPAAWLIETAGYKGFRQGDAGVHKHQALVLVNYGQATGAEIWRLAQSIQDKVEKEFGIRLMPEVNIY